MPQRPPDGPQPALFDAPAPLRPTRRNGGEAVGAADNQRWLPLAAELGAGIHLGTSSWNFPGWSGLVWDAAYPESTLSRHGLAAYGRHPLLRAVSVDRSFYRPVEPATFAAMAAQVPDDFRFVVKAPALVSDAQQRAEGSGRGVADNPGFLEPKLALETAVRPAAEGLGRKLGALVLQLSPLGRRWLADLPALHTRLESLFAACMPEMPPGAVLALEVRDRALLGAELAALLKRHGVRYCLGLHDRMPTVAEQLPMLRAMWPGPLVCRWNLQRGLKYDEAKDLFSPFDRLQAPDPANREELARVIAGTVAAGYAAFATINNKAEGSAPLSVIELAKAIARRMQSPG